MLLAVPRFFIIAFLCCSRSATIFLIYFEVGRGREDGELKVVDNSPPLQKKKKCGPREFGTENFTPLSRSTRVPEYEGPSYSYSSFSSAAQIAGGRVAIEGRCRIPPFQEPALMYCMPPTAPPAACAARRRQRRHPTAAFARPPSPPACSRAKK